MTPEEQAVIEKANAWAAKIPADVNPTHLDSSEQELLAAVRAMEPPAPVLPEEPPVGEFVACGPDSNLLPFYRRWDEGWEGIVGGDATWPEIVERARERAKRDPVRLVPATDVVPAYIARELAEALREFAAFDCRCIEGFDNCPSTAHTKVRDLLARADAAIGGGR